MRWLSFEATASVAYKEFLHIYRDRRVLLLVLLFPPLFTLLFGHAFETSEMTDVPCHVDQSGQHTALARVHRYHLQEQDVPMALRIARHTKRIGFACLPRARNARHSAGLE